MNEAQINSYLKQASVESTIFFQQISCLRLCFIRLVRTESRQTWAFRMYKKGQVELNKKSKLVLLLYLYSSTNADEKYDENVEKVRNRAQWFL